MRTVPFQTDAEVATALPQVLTHLRSGGLLAYPTETVYGLGSRARPRDVAALARLKGRRAGRPFLLLVADRAMAEGCGLAFNPAADALARALWPGALTLVLPGGGAHVPDSLRGPEGGVAVRWTAHPHIARLIAELGEPLTSTSANLPGAAPAPGVVAIMRDFAAAVNAGVLLVLDGGVLGSRRPSTVVDCTTPNPRLVRPGAISLTELQRVAGGVAS